jgi:hypothetical protein
MADEELRISVKVDQAKAAENARTLQESFRGITDVQHIGQFEKLGRQFALTDIQIKQLAEVVGKPTGALAGFATGFGRAGAILLGFEAAVAVAKAISQTFTDAASRQLDISNAAKRMGNIHAAQLEANIEAMERERIERGRGIAMMEKFAEKRAEFQKARSEFRRSIMESAAPEFAEVVRRHFSELDQAADPTAQMNLVRRFAEEIEKYYRERGMPERGAMEKRAYLEKWFGLSDISQLTVDFVKVSKEAEEAWDRNQTAAQEYWRVTTDISNNFSHIVASVLTQTMDEMGIGALLRAVNSFLERGVKEHDEIGAMDPEERARYLDSLVKEGDAAWRKAIIDFLFNKSPGSHAFPRPGGRPGEMQPQRLLESLTDNQSDLIAQEKLLVENLQFLNAILSGESGIGGGKTTFHNSPQGGAEGESNPVQIPDDVAQPGGGAQAEARKPKSAPLRGMPPPPAGMPINKSDLAGPPIRTVSPEETRALAQASGSAVVQIGLGKVGGNVFTSQQFLSDPRVAQTMGLEQYDAQKKQELVDETRGFSTPGGVAYDPTKPTWKGTLAHELGHVGREVVTNELAGAEPNIFQRYGLKSQPSVQAPAEKMEELRQRALDLKIAQRLEESGAISTANAGERRRQALGYLGAHVSDLPELTRHEDLLERSAQGIISGGAKFNPRTGQPILFGADREDLDAGRRMLDGDMGAEMDVSGRLNVQVDAPRGTEVKANGGGMFENNVSVDRRMADEARP